MKRTSEKPFFVKNAINLLLGIWKRFERFEDVVVEVIEDLEIDFVNVDDEKNKI